MKKNIIIFCLMFLNIQIFAHDDAYFFNKAQHEFAQEQWDKALFDYQKIKSKNSIVWQNLAHCLYNKQQYAQALVAVKRAIYLASCNQLNNLQNLENNIYHQLHLEPLSYGSCLVRKFLFFIPLFILQIIFLLILIQIFLILLHRYRWSDFTLQEGKKLKKLIIILCLCISLWYVKRLSFIDDKAIVIQSDAIVYAGPDESFHQCEKLQPGIEVKIIKSQNKMYHIKTSRISGWVNMDVLEPVIGHE